MSQTNAREIAERIIEFTENEELRQLWGTVGRYEQIDQLSIELAKAYLELEKEKESVELLRKRNLAMRCGECGNVSMWSSGTSVMDENTSLKSEIAELEACVARLKEENEALQQGISDMERAYDNVKDGLSKNICGYCEQSMNSDQNPSYEQLVVANDFNQQEIAKLKEENAQLSKYCGEVRAWQNRAEDLSEEKEKLKEQNSGLIEALERIASPKHWAIGTFVPGIRERVKIAREALKKWGGV